MSWLLQTFLLCIIPNIACLNFPYFIEVNDYWVEDQGRLSINLIEKSMKLGNLCDKVITP